MKCPFCNEKLVMYWGMENLYCCDNCSNGGIGTEQSWQALIDTKKKLDRCLNLAEEMLRNIEDEGMCSSSYEEELHQIKDKE